VDGYEFGICIYYYLYFIYIFNSLGRYIYRGYSLDGVGWVGNYFPQLPHPGLTLCILAIIEFADNEADFLPFSVAGSGCFGIS
jgi:hypothetical protein